MSVIASAGGGVFVERSFANFLLLPVKPGMAIDLQASFFRRGFLIKLISRAGLRGEWLRLPIKDPRTNTTVADLLAENISCLKSRAEMQDNWRPAAN